MAEGGLLAAPSRITVRQVSGERFPRVIAYALGDKPEVTQEWQESLAGDLGYFERREPTAMPPRPELEIADDDEVPF